MTAVSPIFGFRFPVLRMLSAASADLSPAAIQAYLKQLNGQGTVPHVYIGQEFIGGCSDLQAIPAPKLKAKINGSK